MHLPQKILNLLLIFNLGVVLSSCALFNSVPPLPEPLPAQVQAPVAKKPIIKPQQAHLAYIAEGNGRVYLCKLAADGSLVDCDVTGKNLDGIKPAWLPNNVSLYDQDNQTYAYIASSQSVFMCMVESSGNLFNCKETGYSESGSSLIWVPNEVTFDSESNIARGYITGVSNVYLCDIGSDGGLNHCTTTGSSDTKRTWLPNGITFNQLQEHTVAYVAAARNLYLCEVDPTNGGLVNCQKTGSNHDGSKLSWHPNNTLISAKSAYISDPYHLYLCGVESSGAINNCKPTGSAKSGGALNWLPHGAAITTVYNKAYGYVVDEYNIYLCNIDSSGNFTNCKVTGISKTHTMINWNPNSLAFY